MIVNLMQREDIDSCVDVHLKAFPNFFLTFLGGRFLRVLYRTIIADRSGIGLVAKVDGAAAGFVVGSSQPAGLYGRLLKRHWWQFGWAALPAFLRSPAILPRLLRAFALPGQELPAANCATLMSIAVHPDHQGEGVGKLLAQGFLAQAKQGGSAYVNLTTDARNNESTNRFYQSLGFSLLRTYTTPQGREMNEYVIQL